MKNFVTLKVNKINIYFWSCHRCLGGRSLPMSWVKSGSSGPPGLGLRRSWWHLRTSFFLDQKKKKSCHWFAISSKDFAFKVFTCCISFTLSFNHPLVQSILFMYLTIKKKKLVDVKKEKLDFSKFVYCSNNSTVILA